MFIEKIKLKNFRNYIEQEIKLNNGINLFYGNNAQGKTNIIESIFLCSMGKSFRARREKEIINFNKNETQVEIKYTKKDREGKIKYIIGENKNIFINNIQIKKMSEILRNINIVFESIYFSKKNIETWYKKIENNKNEREVNIHNNITLDHYIKNEKPYLISWDRSTIDSPIYDLLSFYKNHYLELDFDDLFNYYESNYPLKEEEKILLFTYMAMPSKIEVENDEYKMCIKINKLMDYLYKTSNLIMNYHKDN